MSTDDGYTWNIARLVPPLSDQTWVLWRWIWHPTATGLYTFERAQLMARHRADTGSNVEPFPMEPPVGHR